MDAIQRLEQWKAGHKARAVDIQHANGYGASCWEVQLSGERLAGDKWGDRRRGTFVIANEVAFWEHDPEDGYGEMVFATRKGDDWPGLARTIHAAIDRWEVLEKGDARE